MANGHANALFTHALEWLSTQHIVDSISCENYGMRIEFIIDLIICLACASLDRARAHKTICEFALNYERKTISNWICCEMCQLIENLIFNLSNANYKRQCIIKIDGNNNSHSIRFVSIPWRRALHMKTFALSQQAGGRDRSLARAHRLFYDSLIKVIQINIAVDINQMNATQNSSKCHWNHIIFNESEIGSLNCIKLVYLFVVWFAL